MVAVGARKRGNMAGAMTWDEPLIFG